MCPRQILKIGVSSRPLPVVNEQGVGACSVTTAKTRKKVFPSLLPAKTCSSYLAFLFQRCGSSSLRGVPVSSVSMADV